MGRLGRRRATPEDADEQPSARATLFPTGQDVQLQSGDMATVRPWSIETTETILQRIPEIFDMVRKGQADAEISSLAGGFFTEVQTLVEISLGWERGSVRERCTTIDLFSLLEVIWDVNVTPLRGKLQGMGGRVEELLGQQLSKMLRSSGPSTS